MPASSAGHQPAVSNHVGCEYRRKPALDFVRRLWRALLKNIGGWFVVGASRERIGQGTFAPYVRPSSRIVATSLAIFPAGNAKYSDGADVRGALPMAPSSPDDFIIKAYWQPGCTSCLRMKEFLTKHGVSFVSINVLEDKAAFAELATLGIRQRADRAPWQRLGERPGAEARWRASPASSGAAQRCSRARAGLPTRRRYSGSAAAVCPNPRGKARPAAAAIDRAATPSSPTTFSTSPTRSWSTRSRACRSRKAPTIACRRRR